MRLDGRRIIISGAASGIGLATASLFRSEGAAVGLMDKDAAGLSTAVAELRADHGASVGGEPCDITDAASVESAIASLASEMGGVDGIVGSAGIDCNSTFDQMSIEEWDRVLAVNLTGPFHLSRAALPHLRAAGAGTIVHIASGAALRPLAARTAYCASKAGLVMFAKSLAIDLAPIDVRVNAICPGVVDTPMFREPIAATAEPEAELEAVLSRYLIQKVADPSDIANAALFLTSSESSHITGTALAVDGGRTFH